MGWINYKRVIFPLGCAGTAFGLFVLIKDRWGGAKYEADTPLFGRTVVVTGANTGIGKETAFGLAQRGGRVILACRDLNKCEEAREFIIKETFNTNVHCRKLDLASNASIRSFADDIIKNEKRLDILINNAGVMTPPSKELTDDGYELQFGVNFLGPSLLTKLLLDKLKECAPSRIVNVTCLSWKKGAINFKDLNSDIYYDKEKAYKQSKRAFYMIGVEQAERLQDTGVTLYNVNPGISMTEIGRHLGMNKSKISSVILGPLWTFVLKTPRQGCQTVLHCALSPTDQLVHGSFYEECRENRVMEKYHNKDRALRLWAVSEAWTKNR